jgi:hypothetical protein
MPGHVETHAERLKRYQRKAREFRELTAHARDRDTRYDLKSIADAYDLLAELEAADQDQAKLLRP